MKRKSPVQLPDGRFAKILWWDKNAQGWQIEVVSKEGRGERGIYPDHTLRDVSPTVWQQISCNKRRKQAGRTKNQTGMQQISRMKGACPQCETPPPSYRSGVKCPNCEYLEHSFKRWLEDATTAGSVYGNETDPEEHGLKRVGHLRRPVPDSAMADRLFLGNKKFLRKSGKRRKSTPPSLCNLRRPNEPRS